MFWLGGLRPLSRNSRLGQQGVQASSTKCSQYLLHGRSYPEEVMMDYDVTVDIFSLLWKRLWAFHSKGRQ
jgi:hypothetical protein